MLNVYVHLAVEGLPADTIHDDVFVEGMWRELPDAGVGGRLGAITITLSQWALSRSRAAARQHGRVTRALAALGHPGVEVRVEEALREGWRDDVDVVRHAIGWHIHRVPRARVGRG